MVDCEDYGGIHGWRLERDGDANIRFWVRPRPARRLWLAGWGAPAAGCGLRNPPCITDLHNPPTVPCCLQFQCCKPNDPGSATWDPKKAYTEERVSDKRSEGNHNCERASWGATWAAGGWWGGVGSEARAGHCPLSVQGSSPEVASAPRLRGNPSIS